MCRRILLSETSTLLSTAAVTHFGQNLNHLPVTVHMIFDFFQLVRKVLSLDRKGKARELQSYLVVQYRGSKKSNLKRKEKIAKCYHKPCKVLFWRSFSQENKRVLIRRRILSGVCKPIHWTTQDGREYGAHIFFMVCWDVHNLQSPWILILWWTFWLTFSTDLYLFWPGQKFVLPGYDRYID